MSDYVAPSVCAPYTSRFKLDCYKSGPCAGQDNFYSDPNGFCYQKDATCPPNSTLDPATFHCKCNAGMVGGDPDPNNRNVFTTCTPDPNAPVVVVPPSPSTGEYVAIAAGVALLLWYLRS